MRITPCSRCSERKKCPVPKDIRENVLHLHTANIQNLIPTSLRFRCRTYELIFCEGDKVHAKYHPQTHGEVIHYIKRKRMWRIEWGQGEHASWSNHYPDEIIKKESE